MMLRQVSLILCGFLVSLPSHSQPFLIFQDARKSMHALATIFTPQAPVNGSGGLKPYLDQYLASDEE